MPPGPVSQQTHTPECSAQPKECRAAMHIARLHADSTADPQCYPASFVQADEDTNLCHQQTNRVSMSKTCGTDAAEEEALTLDYQPATNQHFPEHQSVGVLASSNIAPRLAGVADGSGVGKKACRAVPQNSHKQRVWRNKHCRRDGVMDLWRRAGMQLHHEATDK